MCHVLNAYTNHEIFEVTYIILIIFHIIELLREETSFLHFFIQQYSVPVTEKEVLSK